MASGKIYVYADWGNLPGTILMGILNSDQVRGKEVFSFEYDKNWLGFHQAILIDPDLKWYSGQQFLPDNKVNFGLFMDSSPDRWGRVLMRRREALLARMDNRPQKTLLPSDYLLGVYDEHRMGALRFKDSPDGPFLNDYRKMAAPPWTSIRELEYASLKLEEDNSADDPDFLHWLNLLTAPGSSLGGARPKASVVDKDGQLWIAKFPSKNDETDTGGWEMVVHELAKKSGIILPEALVQKFNSHRYTFLTKRFDRTSKGRIHFASSMTLTGRKDGDDFQSGATYLELAGIIIQFGDKNYVDSDLEELWKRIVFSLCVKNTDDHLRNHGFLLGENGWRLSPAYDINPVPTGTGLTLNINENDNSLSLELAKEVAVFFRIESKRADQIIQTCINAVSDWRKVASEYEIPRNEMDLMSAAFEH